MNPKLLSLISLSVQNAVFAISIRYSRVRSETMFLASTGTRSRSHMARMCTLREIRIKVGILTV